MGARPSRMVAFRLELARRREAGEAFEEAWREAKRTLPPERYMHHDWRSAVEATRDAWARAWAGEPPTPGELAAAQLALVLGEEEAGERADAALVA